jgi:predicted ATPase
MAEQGRHEEGIAQIQEGLTASRAIGAELALPRDLCLLAEVCMNTGRLDDGLIVLAEALAAVNEHEIRVFEPEIHRLKGDLLLSSPWCKWSPLRSCRW